MASVVECISFNSLPDNMLPCHTNLDRLLRLRVNSHLICSTLWPFHGPKLGFQMHPRGPTSRCILLPPGYCDRSL